MTEAAFRELVRGSLAGFNVVVEQAISDQVARRCGEGLGAAVFFLVCPHRYGVWLLDEEEPILAQDKLLGALGSSYRQAVEAEEFDGHAAVGRELLPWLGDRWAAVGGPARFGPAFAFYDDPRSFSCEPRQPWYDLPQRRWVWDEAPPGRALQSGDIPF